MNRSIAVALLAAAFVASGQPASAQGPGPISCVLDRLTPADRKLIAGASTDGDDSPAAMRQINDVVSKARDACSAANNWNVGRRNRAISYAMDGAVLVELEARLAAGGFSAERLRAGWNSLSAEDRAALLSDDISPAITRAMSERLRGIGTPPALLGEGLLAWTAMSSMASVSSGWEPRPNGAGG